LGFNDSMLKLNALLAIMVILGAALLSAEENKPDEAVAWPKKYRRGQISRRG